MTNHQAELDAVREADRQSRWYVDMHTSNQSRFVGVFDYAFNGLSEAAHDPLVMIENDEAIELRDFITELVKRIEELETDVIRLKAGNERWAERYAALLMGEKLPWKVGDEKDI